MGGGGGNGGTGHAEQSEAWAVPPSENGFFKLHMNKIFFYKDVIESKGDIQLIIVVPMSEKEYAGTPRE